MTTNSPQFSAHPAPEPDHASGLPLLESASRERKETSPEAYATASAHRVYWGKIAPRYDGFIDTMMGEETRGRTLRRLGCKRTLGRVLEVGCGTGINTDTLAAKATRVVATDLSPGMLEIAKKKVRSTNVSFRAADCRCLPFDSKSFDTAVLGLVLHLANPEDTLREIARVVRPGGSALIVNPAVLSMRALARFGCRCRMLYYGITRFWLKPPGDFAQFLLTGEALCELLESNGWTNVRLENIPSSSGRFGLPLEFIEAVRKPEFLSA